MAREIEWVAEVFPDWTTLRVGEDKVFAFNRETGRVYKIPHPDCPFVPFFSVQKEHHFNSDSML